MAQETVQLAQYAASLRAQDLPAQVIQRAKDCIADTIAAIAFGAALPWSRYIRPSGRSVAQPGSALRSGRRGRRFKSCHSDQLHQSVVNRASSGAYRRSLENGQSFRLMDRKCRLYG